MNVSIVVSKRKVPSGVLIENRTYARARDVLEAAGYDVSYENGVLTAVKKPSLQISEYFHLSEFACRCCGRVMVNAYFEALLERLHEMRALIRRPVIVNSGYRCPNHNAAVGGAEDSYHMKGAAADIRAEGMSPGTLAEVAKGLSFGFIKVYPVFVHVDVREHRLQVSR